MAQDSQTCQHQKYAALSPIILYLCFFFQNVFQTRADTTPMPSRLHWALMCAAEPTPRHGRVCHKRKGVYAKINSCAFTVFERHAQRQGLLRHSWFLHCGQAQRYENQCCAPLGSIRTLICLATLMLDLKGSSQ